MRLLVLPLLFILAVILPLLGMVTSRTFQGCINEGQTQAYNSGQSVDKKSPAINIVIDERCFDQFVVKFNAAITAIATVLLTFVTIGLVWVTYTQFKTARAQLRAYVSAWPHYTVSFNKETFAGVKVRLINAGETPAKNVRHLINIDVFPSPLPDGFSFPPLTGNKSPGIVLFPNLPFDGEKTADRLFTFDEIRGIRDGKARIYIFGEVYYRDIFNKLWCTTFGASVTGRSNMLKQLTSLYKLEDLKVIYEATPQDNEAT